MVDNLLTTKELQKLLKIDQTTVYRMLKDGRLTGIKMGRQWRFARAEVKALLASTPPSEPNPVLPRSLIPDVLPLYCIQLIQKIFEMAAVGAVTATATGEPLTEINNACRFCRLIQASEAGRRACIASWRKLAEQAESPPHLVTCHAGLQYTHARIEVDGPWEGMLIAGQFYLEAPTPDEEARRIQHLAEQYGIDPAALAEAAREIEVLEAHKQRRMGAWLQSIAQMFEELAHERAEWMGRLRRIAEMSTLEPA